MFPLSSGVTFAGLAGESEDADLEGSETEALQFSLIRAADFLFVSLFETKQQRVRLGNGGGLANRCKARRSR